MLTQVLGRRWERRPLVTTRRCACWRTPPVLGEVSKRRPTSWARGHDNSVGKSILLTSIQKPKHSKKSDARVYGGGRGEKKQCNRQKQRALPAHSSFPGMLFMFHICVHTCFHIWDNFDSSSLFAVYVGGLANGAMPIL